MARRNWNVYLYIVVVRVINGNGHRNGLKKDESFLNVFFIINFRTSIHTPSPSLRPGYVNLVLPKSPMKLLQHHQNMRHTDHFLQLDNFIIHILYQPRRELRFIKK